MISEGEPANRRERQRAATVAEIKQRAWAQVADGGVLAVSLRAIARQMGMTSSALYRYFASHEDLVADLVTEGFASLADTLEAAETELPPTESLAARWIHVSSSYRSWALEHPAAYSLVFSTPMAGVKAVGGEDDPEDTPAMAEFTRGVAVLFRLMIEGMTTGQLDSSRLPPPEPGLAAKLDAWRDHLGLPLTSQTLTACLFIYSLVHGAVSGELFGQLPPLLVPAGDLFEQHMWAVLTVLGCPEAIARSGR
jgi:AcrR family transcriptional regulator